MKSIAWFCLAMLASLHGLCSAGQPEAEVFNPDELKRTEVAKVGDKRVVVVTWQDQAWRETDVSIFTSEEAINDPVCFEAKYMIFVPPNKVRLGGTTGFLVVDERMRQSVAKMFRSGDNIWVFGTPRQGDNGKREVAVVEMFKLTPDVVRWEARIASLEKNEDYNSLIELGLKIEEQGRNLPIGQANALELQDRILTLRNKAIDSGLSKNEKKLDPNDADGHYALALKWRDLRQKPDRYRNLVLKTLKINPNHPRASRDAAERLGMVQDSQGVWRTKQELAVLQEQAVKEKERRAQEEAKALAERESKRQKDEATRMSALISYQSALRTNDLQSRDGAIRSLGEAIKTSIDPGFGERAVDILVNVNSQTAVVGLNIARESELPEVRRLVFDALVWRGLCVGKDDTALFAITNGLKAEKDLPTAKAGIDALVSAGGPGAVGVLVASLDTAEQAVMTEAIEGLKRSTKLNYPSREGWQDWWSKTKDTVAPDAFKN